MDDSYRLSFSTYNFDRIPDTTLVIKKSKVLCPRFRETYSQCFNTKFESFSGETRDLSIEKGPHAKMMNGIAWIPLIGKNLSIFSYWICSSSQKDPLRICPFDLSVCPSLCYFVTIITFIIQLSQRAFVSPIERGNRLSTFSQQLPAGNLFNKNSRAFFGQRSGKEFLLLLSRYEYWYANESFKELLTSLLKLLIWKSTRGGKLGGGCKYARDLCRAEWTPASTTEQKNIHPAALLVDGYEKNTVFCRNLLEPCSIRDLFIYFWW